MKKDLLMLAHNQVLHPLNKRKTFLIGCCISGDTSKIRAFQNRLQKLSLHRGDTLLTNSMNIHGELECVGYKRNINPITPNEVDIINYLSSLCSENKSYSCVNTHKYAIVQTLASLGNDKFVSSPFIARFMKGIFNLKPPIPRYKEFWDVKKVLEFLASQFPLESLSLKMLTLKTIALLALSTAQRSQTLSMLNINNMNLTEDYVVFSIQNLHKTSKLGNLKLDLKINAFHQKGICPVCTIKRYIEMTKEKRKSEKLLVSFKTYEMVTSSTIARWLKEVLQLSGIDVSNFKAHSFRGATTSAAYMAGVTLQDILQTANWGSAKTFHKFYHRDVVDHQLNFSHSVLSEYMQAPG